MSEELATTLIRYMCSVKQVTNEGTGQRTYPPAALSFP